MSSYRACKELETARRNLQRARHHLNAAVYNQAPLTETFRRWVESAENDVKELERCLEELDRRDSSQF